MIYPTNTPLNLCNAPNGKIIGKVKNNTVIYVTEYQYDSKVFNAKNNQYLGWSYREFISCY